MKQVYFQSISTLGGGRAHPLFPVFTSISPSLVIVCRVGVGNKSKSLFAQPSHCTTNNNKTQKPSQEPQACWHTSVIPAPKRLRQKDYKSSSVWAINIVPGQPELHPEWYSEPKQQQETRVTNNTPSSDNTGSISFTRWWGGASTVSRQGTSFWALLLSFPALRSPLTHSAQTWLSSLRNKARLCLQNTNHGQLCATDKLGSREEERRKKSNHLRDEVPPLHAAQ